MIRDSGILERVMQAKGSDRATNALIEDYMPYIKAETSRALGGAPAGQHEDEVSIAMFAFYEAVQTYDEKRGAFLQYASTLIRNKIIDYLRKQARHRGVESLDAKQERQGESRIMPLGAEEADQHTRQLREATREEIEELGLQLNGFGLSFSDVAENCPRQERSFLQVKQAVRYAKEHPALLEETKRSGRLPVAKISEGAKVSRKLIERHRKYLMALMLIYSNGYELIRGHLSRVFETIGAEGGKEA